VKKMLNIFSHQGIANQNPTPDRWAALKNKNYYKCEEYVGIKESFYIFGGNVN
jgi:hypothetical protein